MVKIYESEQEQIDALKSWWKDNGVSVILGVVIGVSGILAWNGWQQHQKNNQIQASAYYLQVMENIQQKKYDEVPSLVDKVVADYDGTHYASLSQLSGAKAAYESNNIDQAKSRLSWVIENASEDYFAVVARLRLARLFYSENQLEEAEKLLTVAAPEAFDAQRQSLLGDVMMAKGDVIAARDAYNNALSAKVSVANPQLLQDKLNNLPAAVSE